MGFADEATDGVGLAGAGAAAFDIHTPDLALRHFHENGAVAEGAEVDGEWSVGTVEFAEGANAISGAGGEDGKFGARGEVVSAFEFGRSDEFDAHAGDGLGRWREVESKRRDSGLILDRAVLIDHGRGVVELIALANVDEFDLTARRAEAVASELGEGEDQIGDRCGAGVEEVEVEVKGLAGGEGLGVEVEGAEDEGTRMVGEAAGC